MSSPTIEASPGMHRNDGQGSAPAYWSGIFAMTLCVFALIASEFMPVSLLTPIARDLSVSEGLAGYGIAISGAFAVLTSLTIARLAGSLDRKTLLLLLTALMCVSGLIVGSASNYSVYMLGRALIGVVIGGFWSMSAAVAMRLVPKASVPRARLGLYRHSADRRLPQAQPVPAIDLHPVVDGRHRRRPGHVRHFGTRRVRPARPVGPVCHCCTGGLVGLAGRVAAQ